jgi:hypothetical protein
MATMLCRSIGMSDLAVGWEAQVMTTVSTSKSRCFWWLWACLRVVPPVKSVILNHLNNA